MVARVRSEYLHSPLLKRSRHKASDHFVGAAKMIELGKGATQEYIVTGRVATGPSSSHNQPPRRGASHRYQETAVV